VIGIPDERFGEALHAVIVPLPGSNPSLESIRGHCQQQLAGYKCPRSIELVDSLPLSAMNKVLKNVLRERSVERAAASGQTAGAQ
jgi:acyl-CoA synthetase (AMP-forming)/AMP-acid ligase II